MCGKGNVAKGLGGGYGRPFLDEIICERPRPSAHFGFTAPLFLSICDTKHCL